MQRIVGPALLALVASALVNLPFVGCTSADNAPPPGSEDASVPGADSSLPLPDASPGSTDAALSDVGVDVVQPTDAGADTALLDDAGVDATTPVDASDASPAPDAADTGAPDSVSPTDAAVEAAGDGSAPDAGDDAGLDASADAGGSDATPDASLCPAVGCPASCAAIFAQDGGAPDGTYAIDPGTGPIQVACLMSVNGGGWTPLVPPVASALDAVTSKVYLYLLGAAWYESPPSTLAWSWSSGQQLTGTYSYFDGVNASSYSCAGSGEIPQFGIGCSNGPGGNLKTLPYYSEDPANAQCEVCQDQPNAFGTGACGTGVSVYVR